MAQNMNVSVTLRLQDQFTGPIRAMMQQLQGLTRTAQEFNRAASNTGWSAQLNRMHGQIRGLTGEVRNLANQFSQLGRAMAAPIGGNVAQQHIAGMRQLLSIQQQALANNTRLAAGAGGAGGRVPAGPGSWFGRSGFNPNASLVDRAQYRAVNFGERSLISGVLDLSQARSRLAQLAMPNPDPSNPDNLRPGVIMPEVVAQAEAVAAELSQGFRTLNRAHILDTFTEIVTQFQNVEDAFAFLPQLLNVQEWQVLQGDTVQEAREGMLRLLRAIGLSGRLVGNDGRLKMDEASGFLETYLRARMIGGRDITPDQVFQVMKYLKATGQSLSQESLLTAFIAMPDIRGSTFGNQLNMMVRQLTGGATQAAQQAMAAAGLGTIIERTASGPHRFTPIDEVLLRDNPFEWFNRHILGPEGLLRRRGIDPLNATAAQIAEALRPIFSNQSAENIANMIVNQQQEWRNQIQNALSFNLTPEARQQHVAGNLWPGLMSAQSSLQDVLGSVASNFEVVLLPAINKVSDGFKTLAGWLDPRTGSPALSMGVLAAGAVGSFLALRGVAARMGPLSRTLVGGAAGGLLGGGVGEALMGALIGRQLSGSSAAVAGAAGAAGAAAGRAWGGRFVAAAGSILRGLRSMTLGGVAIGIGTTIITEWETVRDRLKMIWTDLQRAAPRWLGGEGWGWQQFFNGPARRQLATDLETWLRETVRPSVDATVRWLEETQESIRLAVRNHLIPGPRDPDAPTGFAQWLRDQEHGAMLAARNRSYGPPTVTVGAVHVHVTTPPGADPNAVGEAAGGAVGNALRDVMADIPGFY